MALYPTFAADSAVEGNRTMCRPAPIGGCISLLKYERLTSNRLKEFGPYDRFIDRARLTTALTLDDIYGLDRYAIALKNSLMGVAIADRQDFLNAVYPFAGMGCP